MGRTRIYKNDLERNRAWRAEQKKRQERLLAEVTELRDEVRKLRRKPKGKPK
jgi:hypothetical protein